MQRYKNLFVYIIRFILVFLFIYILPTRSIFDKLIYLLFNMTNKWFYLFGKVPILISLLYIYNFIDKRNLYTYYDLKKEIQHKPLHYSIAFIIVIDVLLTFILIICDKLQCLQIVSSDWINYINNLFTANITFIGGLFALYQYLSIKDKEATPKISIKINHESLATYKTNFYHKTKESVTISLELLTEHYINELSIRSNVGYTKIYSITDNSILETLSKDNPINISLQLVDGYDSSAYYDIIIKTDEYEQFNIPFKIVHSSQCIDNYQLIQSKARKER